jgi:hypothetical protein
VFGLGWVCGLWCRGWFVVLLVVCGFVGVPSCALGAFSRVFVRQVARAEVASPESVPARSGLSCVGESPRGVSCLSPGGVLVDGSGGLWVGDGFSSLAGFDGSSGVFLPPLVGLEGNYPLPSGKENYSAPDVLAFDGANGNFYFSGQNRLHAERRVEVVRPDGGFVEQWALAFGGALHIAFDNSSSVVDPSRGSVYVAHEQEDPVSGDDMLKGVGRFSPSGVPLEFSDAKKCEEEGEKCGYIKGNTIIGTPSVTFGFQTPQGVAVDSEGDIFVVGGALGDEVDEFLPSGVFVRAFTGVGTPGLAGNHEFGGFGGQLQSVVVDPVSGHVLVSLNSEKGEVGAVDEFDSSGRFLNQFTGTEVEVSAGVRRAGSLESALEMTVDPSGEVYVVDGREGVVDEYGAGHFLPSFRLAEASERHPASAVLNGFVNSEGLRLTDCHFEYVTETAFRTTGFADLTSGGNAACVAPDASGVPVDTSYHAVHAGVGDLLSGVVYVYRLASTTSASELGGTAYSGTVAFTAPAVPVIVSSSVSNVSSEFADLSAVIDALGADTSYRFEYSVNGVDWTAVPVPDGDVGAGGVTGSVQASVVQHAGPLIPGTSYRFRVVASNSVGSISGGEGGFSTLALSPSVLADGRAYELVTPANKEGASDMFTFEEGQNFDRGYASESGDGFLLTTSPAAYGSFPAAQNNEYLFSRDRVRGEWGFRSLVGSSLGVQSLTREVFDPVDFSHVGIDDEVGSRSSVAGTALTTLVGPVGGPYAKLHADPPVHEEGQGARESGETVVAGGSRDLSRVVLESENHTIVAGDEEQDAGSSALYEWSGGGECGQGQAGCRLINVDSKGVLVSRCGAVLGQGHVPGYTHNAVSVDGSRIFFTAPDPYMVRKPNGELPSGCWDRGVEHAPQLYMRSGGSTVLVSKPENGVKDPSGQHFVQYVGASSDGSRVFFVTETELTEDDTGIHDMELYMYDTVALRLRRVSAGESGHDAANVSTVPVVAENGSAVYFTAFGWLAAGSAPVLGPEDAYLYRYDTVTGKTAYIGMIGEGQRDYPTFTIASWGPLGALSPETDWYASPDGRFLLFKTARELTGQSTVEASPRDCQYRDDTGGSGLRGHCSELYRYDSVTGGLVCVSCDPSGGLPVSNAVFSPGAFPSNNPAAGGVRAMSDDGSFVFFDSSDALVSGDTNGTQDVYEWHDGVVSLISSGEDPAQSYFLGTSASGHDVFFGTHARLVPQDTDSAGDIYDARVCEPENGDPCIGPRAGGTVQCEGDACQNPPPAPTDATPGSMSLAGAGNTTTTGLKPKGLTRSQLLGRALKECRGKPKRKRAACERAARKRYAAKSKAGVVSRSHRSSGNKGGRG